MKFWCVLLYLLGNVTSINIQEDHLFLDKSKPLLIQCFTNKSSANIEFRLDLDSIATCKFSGHSICVVKDSRFMMFVNSLHIPNYFQLESVNTFDQSLCGTYTCIDLDTGINDSVSVSFKESNGEDDKDPSRISTGEVIGIVVPVVFVCAVCVLGFVLWRKKRMNMVYYIQPGWCGNTPSYGSRRSSFEMNTDEAEPAACLLRRPGLERLHAAMLPSGPLTVEDWMRRQTVQEAHRMCNRNQIWEDDAGAVEFNWEHHELRRFHAAMLPSGPLTVEDLLRPETGSDDDNKKTLESDQSTMRVSEAQIGRNLDHTQPKMRGVHYVERDARTFKVYNYVQRRANDTIELCKDGKSSSATLCSESIIIIFPDDLSTTSNTSHEAFSDIQHGPIETILDKDPSVIVSIAANDECFATLRQKTEDKPMPPVICKVTCANPTDIEGEKIQRKHWGFECRVKDLSKDNVMAYVDDVLEYYAFAMLDRATEHLPESVLS
ncbi:uncharacterized protein LOC128224407 [Mya arenaria]|uniref:uncharacterized protein LOC128224407 n=1 Tax=Mya arenaria TaxID=6604 RepID=UPI0022E3ED05|nr:uncharacterized protein LOC128224407 [Mya arenaria]